MSQHRTEAQKEAARANGAKSHGPVTPEGKRICSQNARKHGLFAATLVFPDENADAFANLHDFLWNHFLPRDPIEELLVQDMVASRWRVNRVQSVENASMLMESASIGKPPEIHLDGSLWEHDGARASLAFQNVHGHERSGSLIQQSESRYRREFYRAYTELMKRRKEVRQEESQEERKSKKSRNGPGEVVETATPLPIRPDPEPDDDSTHSASIEPSESTAPPEPPSIPDASDVPTARHSRTCRRSTVHSETRRFILETKPVFLANPPPPRKFRRAA